MCFKDRDNYNRGIDILNWIICTSLRFCISGSQVSVHCKSSMVRLSYSKEDTSSYSPVANTFCKWAAILHRLQKKGKLVRLLILRIVKSFEVKYREHADRHGLFVMHLLRIANKITMALYWVLLEQNLRNCSRLRSRRIIRIVVTDCSKLKQNRQCSYNVTLSAFAEPLLRWKSNKYYIF
jgi:hypothetical protein